MQNIFFTADTHFWHENLLKFKRADGSPVRSFNTLFEMNETIIQNWNRVVKVEDRVYHLGDVTFQYDSAFTSLMHRLNGFVDLIPGNHDKLKKDGFLNHFRKVHSGWKKFKEHNFTATHFPMMLGQLRGTEYNLHGHVHEKTLSDPHYISVSVEVRNYTPVHLDEILAEIKRT